MADDEEWSDMWWQGYFGAIRDREHGLNSLNALGPVSSPVRRRFLHAAQVRIRAEGTHRG